MNLIPKPQKRLFDWLALAKENLLSARSSLNVDFLPYRTICLLSQESAQKYLKAYLLSRGWALEKTDNPRKLLEYTFCYEPSFNALISAVNILAEYSLDEFYPGASNFENVGKNEAKEAIEAADKVEHFILEKLKNFDESA